MPLSASHLQDKADRNTCGAVWTVLYANDRSEEPLLRRGFFPEWERNDDAHTYKIVRHAGCKIEPIASEIKHFAHVAHVGKPRIERLYL
jgi:hypothetical protein